MKKIIQLVSLSIVLIVLFSTVATVGAAATPYSTYTYSMDGERRDSPPAYAPVRTIDSYAMNLETPLNGPMDLFVSKDNKIYISDTGNNRVVVLNSDSEFLFEIKEFVNEHGVPDQLSGCKGTFANSEFIYVCDSANARIVVFDLEGNFDHVIYAPEADVMGDDTTFRPKNVAVDASGRMYIVSESTYSGIFAINDDGTFQGFVGVQKVSVPLSVRIRRMIFPNTVTETYNSVEFNNIAIDNDDFIWVTTYGTSATTSKNDTTLETALLGGDENYATVKRLNAAGDDVMVRNGFFMPIGEVMFKSAAVVTANTVGAYGVSQLNDVALGPDGVWSTIDKNRSRIFTYDSEGQLLYAFGDVGSQLGNLKTPVAIDYFGTDLYVLDSTLNCVTVYKRQEYGDMIAEALRYNNNRDYENAYLAWRKVLQRNNNFDAAYVGIGNNLFLKGEYEEAMVNYKAAGDVEGYSKCFKEQRKMWIEKYIWLVVLIIVALIFGVVKFFKFVKKKNNAGVTKTEKRTFWEEVLFGFHLILHPFDGFWDLKHEKRGSVRGALFHVLLAVVAVTYSGSGTAYIFNPDASSKSVLVQMATVIVPLALWCIANWCITTLFDGEGSLKDVFIASSYSLLPLSLLMIPATIFSNFATADDAMIITLLNALALIWVGILIFFGTMTTHGYSMGKNILATLGTILGMVFIMFIAMLFFNLIRRMISFITEVATEISYRAQ